MKREVKTIQIDGCRYNERLNDKTEKSKPHIHWVARVEIIVNLVSGVVVTPEVRDLVRREINQRT